VGVVPRVGAGRADKPAEAPADGWSAGKDCGPAEALAPHAVTPDSTPSESTALVNIRLDPVNTGEG
jgi:hypothetical protein